MKSEDDNIIAKRRKLVNSFPMLTGKFSDVIEPLPYISVDENSRT